jgi:hypothetical protein
MDSAMVAGFAVSLPCRSLCAAVRTAARAGYSKCDTFSRLLSPILSDAPHIQFASISIYRSGGGTSRSLVQRVGTPPFDECVNGLFQVFVAERFFAATKRSVYCHMKTVFSPLSAIITECLGNLVRC